MLPWRLLLLLVTVLPVRGWAQRTEYVYPVGLWVHAPAAARYMPRAGMSTLWSYIDRAFADARHAYAGDWDGDGPLDVACDVEIVRDWVDTFVEGQPSPYPAADCYQPATYLQVFAAPQPIRLPLQATSSASSGCRWDVFLWEQPGPAFFVPGAAQWAVHTGGMGSANDVSLVGWRIAHENLHLVGGRHSDPGCDLMKYVNCDCSTPGCGSMCDLAWQECARTMTPAQIEDSLTREHCDQLLADPHTVPRCTWEKQRYDCNYSGAVDVGDLFCFASKVNAITYGTAPFQRKLDCNHDRAVTVSDHLCWTTGLTNHLFSCPRS